MASSKRDQQGHLVVGVTNRGSGRKIDTWTFYPGDVAGKRDESQEIAFEVAMLHTLEFSVDTKGIPKERWKPLQGPVLAELHAQALTAARAEFDLSKGLTWSDWLEIRIQEPSSYDRRDALAAAQAHLSYSQITRAETPDGRAFTVNGNGVMTAFPTSIGVDREAEKMSGSRRRNAEKEAQIKAAYPLGSARSISALLDAHDSRPANTQYVYLPDTLENRAGLDAIINAIDSINDRLQEFLHPENIENTLQRAMASASRLLAPPEPASPKLPRPK